MVDNEYRQTILYKQILKYEYSNQQAALILKFVSRIPEMNGTHLFSCHLFVAIRPFY